MFVSSQRQARDGRWIHSLHESTPLQRDHALHCKENAPNSSIHGRTFAIANADRRDAVYRYLLGECLLLTPEHGKALLEHRRLPDTTIAARLYSSTPEPERVSEACRELASRFDLDGVPGFFVERGSWRLNVHEHNSPGILIPVSDACGRISALQIRRDSGLPRYSWFSSAEKPHGATSGAPVHFAQPDLVKRSGRAIITEGPLKADICAASLDCCVIGVAGVNCLPVNFGVVLRRDLAELHEVIIAYDSDWRKKWPVTQSIARLSSVVRGVGLRVRMWDWDPSDGKGLDDYLLRERRAA